MGEGWLQEELCSGLTGGNRETGLRASVGREAQGERRGRTDVKEGGVEKVGGAREGIDPTASLVA